MKTLSTAIALSIVATSTLFGASLNKTPINNSLIIYNSNIGLVHEKRELNINKNDTQIIYEGVASTILTDSVNVDIPKDISLFSQQYRFDKLTQSKLLDAHIGKSVDVKVMRDAENFQIIKAILLSNDANQCIVKSEKENIFTVNSNDIIFKHIPKQLITKPSLVWNVKTDKSIESTMSLDYLISKIDWQSNYILNLKKDKADLTGWITINNRSGKSFEDTTLHVLAGDINRVRDSKPRYNMGKSVYAMAKSMPDVEHQAHEGYHFYYVPFKVNLANNEKTQVKFISQNNIDIKRKYSATMYNPNYLGGEMKHDVTQYITIDGLKYPLPKGVVRSYSKLKDTNILLGESSIEHTPKESPISLTLGKNFDIKVKESIIKRDDNKWQYSADVKYNIKNSSDETKIVEILVPFNKNNSSEIKTTQRYNYTKGNLVKFNIKVKPQSAKEFKVHFKSKK